jgi:hypothetical protein
MAVFKWVRPRPRGQILGGDPCLLPRVTREALPALVAGAPTGLHASENRYNFFFRPFFCCIITLLPGFGNA